MADIIAEIQKNLPGTDRERYEIAYRRGRAQANSSLLFGGLGLGSIIGAVLMWLLDPVSGAGRRAEVGQRLTALSNEAARTLGGRTTDLRNRTQGFAIERELPFAVPVAVDDPERVPRTQPEPDLTEPELVARIERVTEPAAEEPEAARTTKPEAEAVIVPAVEQDPEPRPVLEQPAWFAAAGSPTESPAPTASREPEPAAEPEPDVVPVMHPVMHPVTRPAAPDEPAEPELVRDEDLLEIDDPFLVERVRAEIRQALSNPDGIAIAALPDGVILRGQMQAREAREVVERARTVRGVDRVVDRTHHIGAESPVAAGTMPTAR